MGKTLHLADQSLHRLWPPDLEPALQRTQVSGVVSIGIPCLEVAQELQCGLIRIGVQTLKHLCPMRLERVGARASARFCIPVTALADHHTAGAGIVTPESDATDKGAQLAAVKTPGVLGAQFIE